MRRDKRRWKVERTFAWLHSYRRTVTRFERCIGRFDGFVSLACAFIALNTSSSLAILSPTWSVSLKS